jgi:hypothetical protein
MRFFCRIGIGRHFYMPCDQPGTFFLVRVLGACNPYLSVTATLEGKKDQEGSFLTIPTHITSIPTHTNHRLGTSLCNICSPSTSVESDKIRNRGFNLYHEINNPLRSTLTSFNKVHHLPRASARYLSSSLYFTLIYFMTPDLSVQFHPRYVRQF